LSNLAGIPDRNLENIHSHLYLYNFIRKHLNRFISSIIMLLFWRKGHFIGGFSQGRVTNTVKLLDNIVRLRYCRSMKRVYPFYLNQRALLNSVTSYSALYHVSLKFSCNKPAIIGKKKSKKTKKWKYLRKMERGHQGNAFIGLSK